MADQNYTPVDLKTPTAVSPLNEPERYVPQEEDIEQDELDLEFGGTGTYLFGGFLTNTDYNKDWVGVHKYNLIDQMRFGDSSVRAALLAMKLPILSANWYIEGDSQKLNDFVENCLFEDMDHTWAVFLRQALTMLDNGNSIFEKVFKMRDDGKIGWKKFAPRLPRTIFKWAIGDGKIAGITQILPQGGNNVEIPGWKLLRFVNEQEGDNYEGLSVLRPAYKHWYMKDTLYKIDAIATERQGLGIPQLVTPPNIKTDERNALKNALKRMRANQQAYLETPSGVKVEFMDMKAHTIKDPTAMIAHHDREISKAVLAQFLELGSQGGSGSRALSSDHSELFLLSLQAVAKGVQEVMNKAIKELVDLNFPNVQATDYPKLGVGKIGLVDYEKLSIAIKNFFDAQMITPDLETEKHVRQLFDFPEKEEDSYLNPQKTQQNLVPLLTPARQPDLQPTGSRTQTVPSTTKSKMQPQPMKAEEGFLQDIIKFRENIDHVIASKSTTT